MARVRDYLFLRPINQFRYYSLFYFSGRRRIRIAANNCWTGYKTWARVFSLSKSARCYDIEPTQNCSYHSIATKREMIRFTVVPSDASHVFLVTSLYDINPIWNLLPQVPILKDQGHRLR